VLPPKRVLTLLTLAALIVVAAPVKSDAQHVRVGVVAPVHRVVVGGGFYRPWFYDPWFGPWYPYGYGGFYQWGPYPYPYPYRYPYYRDYDAAVRLEVKPKEAEVYVDGYYAGIVDDFDGVFQRLRLPPGDHDLILYEDGYRTVRQHIRLTPDNTLKLKYNMEKLAAGEQPEPRPQPPNPPPQTGVTTGGPGAPPPGYPYPPRQGRVPPGRPPTPPGSPAPPSPPGQPQSGTVRGGAPNAGQAAGYGTITVRVQPGDAEVLIDGQPWRGPQGQDQLVVDVAEGSHTVEIRKSGYRTYVTDVQVRRGETTPVNVSLRSQNEI
jgi:hypothetical protein